MIWPIEELWYTSLTCEAALAAGVPIAATGEYDREEDLAIIDTTIRSIGLEPRRLSYGKSLVSSLLAASPPLLWNINSGLLGPTREAQVPVLCEMLGIPLVGSGSWTAFLTQDKTLALDWYQRMRSPIGAIPGLAVTHLSDLDSERLRDVPPPWFVKPNNEGSSRGIDDRSICRSIAELREKATRMLAEWSRIRIEHFAEGVDVSANLATDRDGALISLCPVAVRYPSGYASPSEKLVDFAHSGGERFPLARLSPQASERVIRCLPAIAAHFRFCHYARFDFRFSPSNGVLYFLEANLCPNFEPNDNFAVSAKWAGLEYREMLSNIFRAACRDAKLSSSPKRVVGHSTARDAGPATA